MTHLLSIPHRQAHGMCPVNGLRDLVQWRTYRDWSNEFMHGLGQGGGFAYLKFNFADPPRQVFWGIASPRQHKYLAQLFNAGYYEIENRSFKYTWEKAIDALDNGNAPVIGPLDMYYLHYYDQIYHQRHIPIHYLLLVGYDAENAYVHDTDKVEVQALPIDDLKQAWEVNVPGLGKRNRMIVVDLPGEIPRDNLLIRKSIADECMTMLHPPVSMIGIPAMEKVAREIAGWPDELGNDITSNCLKQVREYLNSPPDVTGNNLTAGRDIYLTFLEQAAAMSGMNFSAAILLFKQAMSIIPRIAVAIQQCNLANAACGLTQIAKLEKAAYEILSDCVGASG